MNLKANFYHSTTPDEVMNKVNSMLAKAGSDFTFEEISETEGYDDCLVYGLVKKNGSALFKTQTVKKEEKPLQSEHTVCAPQPSSNLYSESWCEDLRRRMESQWESERWRRNHED